MRTNETVQDRAERLQQELLRVLRGPWIPEKIVGRGNSMAALQVHLNNTVPGAFHINGPAGSGKTVLINNVMHRFTKEFPAFALLRVDAYQLNPVAEVYKQLAQTFLGGNMGAIYAEKQVKAYFAAVKQQKGLAYLKEVGAGRFAIANFATLKVVLVVENIDRVSDHVQLRNQLKVIASWADGRRLKLVVTSVDDPNVKANDSRAQTTRRHKPDTTKLLDDMLCEERAAQD